MTSEEKLGVVLKQKGMRIAVAESCTGGLIGSRITGVPGSSDYFEAGMVTYSNRAKELFLSVPHEVIAAKGSVSPEVAELMARGVRVATGVDIGVAVTGIAGPGGGSPEKPVGLVSVALADERGTQIREFHFPGSRERVRLWATQMALEMVRRRIRD